MEGLAFSTSPEASFERLGYRLQRLISSPHVQKRQFVDVVPAEGEREEDWERLLSDFEETYGIKVERLSTGSIRIAWKDFVDC